MRIGIIASNSIKEVGLQQYLPTSTTKLITSSGLGVGQEVVKYAKANKLQLAEKFPDFTKHGSAASFKRDCAIIENSDKVLFFWDGSKGLGDLLSYADNHGIKTIVYLDITAKGDYSVENIKKGAGGSRF